MYGLNLRRSMLVVTLSISVLILALYAPFALSQVATQPSTKPSSHMSNPTFGELVERAEEYAKQKHPGVKFDFTLPAQVTRYPQYWEVTWRLPPDPRFRGGMPIIRLDGVTLEVISAEFNE